MVETRSNARRVNKEGRDCHHGKENVPSGSYGSKISFGDPSIPVRLQSSRGLCAVLELAERPFIYDSRVTCDVKERWGNPWLIKRPRQWDILIEKVTRSANLQYEPSSKVDAPNIGN